MVELFIEAWDSFLADKKYSIERLDKEEDLLVVEDNNYRERALF